MGKIKRVYLHEQRSTLLCLQYGIFPRIHEPWGIVMDTYIFQPNLEPEIKNNHFITTEMYIN